MGRNWKMTPNPPVNADARGHSVQRTGLRAHAGYRERYTAIKTMANGIFDTLKPKRRCQTIP
ncbi:hypothetical protein [Candidatus Kuenenia sp.]|uniref:hypothetical protein n=1 Tax=Candidatus Kuenenia sp. TaxID=2499824 RepID=UPI00322049C0